ncbi:MAG: carboxypeptidase regulatory-like domain-containing protein [Deltaproteobacteria bacterium]|nr:carboxypeptidase regulatory-like domain-containing protein [Deltaproteobacteria bacterium]
MKHTIFHFSKLGFAFLIVLMSYCCSRGSSDDSSDDAIVTGRVVDVSGTAISNAGVSIQLLDLYGTDGSQVDVVVQVLTDANGEYSTSLNPGTYNVVAYAPGYHPHFKEVEVSNELTVDIDLDSANIGYVTGRVIIEGAGDSSVATLRFQYAESPFFYGSNQAIVIELKSIEVLNGQTFLVDLPEIRTAAGGYSLIVSNPTYSSQRIVPITINAGGPEIATVLQDIRLWKSRSISNLLVNPDFENGDSEPWIECQKSVTADATSCRTIPDSRMDPSLSFTPYKVHGGAYGLPIGVPHYCTIDTVASNGNVFYQTFTLSNPGLYEFGGWMRLVSPSYAAIDRVEVTLRANASSEVLSFAPDQIRPFVSIQNAEEYFDELHWCNRMTDWFYFHGYYSHTGSIGDTCTLYFDIKDYFSFSNTTSATVDDLFVRRVTEP